ncbi:MAG: sugar-binding domain-containing protein, partial [Luteococcus sp.]|uniref:sugar-binding domain-containing protein n=1 Tax=Luteococcus sp. TaxID=1969402 RepID=UPI0026474F3D
LAKQGWDLNLSDDPADAEVPSHVYTHNYLTADDIRSLRADGAVGDVCTVFLRADGSHRDIALNARGSGTHPDRLPPTTLCGRLPAARARQAGAGDIDCPRCLERSTAFMALPGWIS